jgi:hypothetical protein
MPVHLVRWISNGKNELIQVLGVCTYSCDLPVLFVVIFTRVVQHTHIILEGRVGSRLLSFMLHVFEYGELIFRRRLGICRGLGPY